MIEGGLELTQQVAQNNRQQSQQSQHQVQQKSRWLVAIIEEVDRPLSRGVAIFSFILAVALAVQYVLSPNDDNADYKLWWLILSFVGLSWCIINIAFWRTLSMRTLRIWWAIVPAVGAVRLLTIGWGVKLEPGQEFYIESWIGGSTFCLFLIFVLRPVWLTTAIMLSAVLPVVSLLLATGSVPLSVLKMVPLYGSFILPAVVYLTVRKVLIRLKDTAAEAKTQEQRRVVAAAVARSRSQFVRLVHDEVLASLSSAMHHEGAPPPEVRRQAARALSMLEEGFSDQSDATESCTEVRVRLEQAVDEMGQAFELDVHAGDGRLPATVVAVLMGATREAMRNSVQHAGPHATRVLHAQIDADEVVIGVRDDGPGFSQHEAQPDRMGVSRSILAPMRELEGAHAEIDTSHGTRVVLRWTR